MRLAGCCHQGAFLVVHSNCTGKSAVSQSAQGRCQDTCGRICLSPTSLQRLTAVQVVRRRAVPKEVGPPPGSPEDVRLYKPVVFFTRLGVPGEVTEGMDSTQGALAACMRAMHMTGTLHYAQT